jgi:signal transduction histidine kinase
MSRAADEASRSMPSSRSWAMVLGVLGIAGLLTIGVVFSGLTAAARVAGNAEELHWANAMMGSAEIARLTVGQAVLVADASDESPAESGDRQRALAEARAAISVAEDWSRRGQPAAEVEAAITRTTSAASSVLDAIEQGDMSEAKRLLNGELSLAGASLVDRLEEVQDDTAASIRATETTANHLGTVLQFLVVLGLPAAALLLYRRRVTRDVRSSKSRMQSMVEEERNRTLAMEAALADGTRRIQTPVVEIEQRLSELAGDATLPPSQRSALSRAHHEAGQVRRIVDDMAVGTAADVGGLALRIEDFELHAELKAVVDGYPAGDISIELGDTKVWVRADKSAVRQIVGNLVDNAVIHGGSAVQIGVGIHTESVTIGVRDNGRGLPSHIRSRLFDQDAEPQGSVVADGGAHGLPVALALALEMDGDLRYKRSGDGWSSLELRLPVAFPGLDADLAPASAGVKAR